MSELSSFPEEKKGFSLRFGAERGGGQQLAVAEREREGLDSRLSPYLSLSRSLRPAHTHPFRTGSFDRSLFVYQ